MQRGPRSAVVLVALLLVGAIGTPLPVAGTSHSGPPDGLTDATGSALAVDAPDRPALPDVQADTHSTIRVTEEYHLTPDQPGRIDVRWHFEAPSSVSEMWTQLPDGATDVRTTRFYDAGDRYEWTGQRSSGSVTFTLSVNETTDREGPEAASGRYKFADAGDWALIRRPYVPVSYRYRGDNPGVTRRTSTDGQGVVGDRLVYLGPHETVERSVHGQRFRLVVPGAATLAADSEDILASVTDASDRLRVGDRDETVLIVAAPTGVSWGILGLQTGDSDFWVRADERLNMADNTWLHEYVHTRQQLNTTAETRWFAEASAEYYAAKLTLAQDRIDYAAFRDHLDQGTRREFRDVRLTDPRTWETNGGNYLAGALVAGELDRRIRLATDSEATFQDVFRRLNRQHSRIEQSDLLGAVRSVGGSSVTDAARHYTERTDRPSTWSQSAHQEAFGTLPPRFRYDLPDPGSEGLAVTGEYRNGSLGDGGLVVGETLTADVTVSNVGGSAGQYDLEVTVDGSSVATRTGRLDAGASTTQTVSHTFTEPGQYRLSTGEDELTVPVREPSTATVTALSAEPSQLRTGGQVTVTASVRNTADYPGEEKMTISRDDETIASERVRLGPGEETTVSTTATLSSAGTYRFTAGNRSVSVTASADGTATRAGTGAGTDGGTDSTPGGSGPGFGPVAVVLALGLLLVGKRVA